MDTIPSPLFGRVCLMVMIMCAIHTVLRPNWWCACVGGAHYVCVVCVPRWVLRPLGGWIWPPKRSPTLVRCPKPPIYILARARYGFGHFARDPKSELRRPFQAISVYFWSPIVYTQTPYFTCCPETSISRLRHVHFTTQTWTFLDPHIGHLLGGVWTHYMRWWYHLKPVRLRLM